MTWYSRAIRGAIGLLFAAGVAVVCALPATAGPRDANPLKELERLQGDWVLVETTACDGTVFKHKDGQPDTNHFNIYIKKDRAIIHFDGTDPDDEFVTTFTVDPQKTPTEIDFTGVSSTITGFKAKGARMLGIYKLEGDTLILTIGWSGKAAEQRPKEFKPKHEGVYSYKFVRSKKPISDSSGRVNERPK